MVLIGCDFHPSGQHVCWVDTETGGIDGWWNDSPQSDSARDAQSFGSPLFWRWRGAKNTAPGEVLLDRAFVLIEEYWAKNKKCRAKDRGATLQAGNVPEAADQGV
jgi:hypothetical protein